VTEMSEKSRKCRKVKKRNIPKPLRNRQERDTTGRNGTEKVCPTVKRVMNGEVFFLHVSARNEGFIGDNPRGRRVSTNSETGDQRGAVFASW